MGMHRAKVKEFVGDEKGFDSILPKCRKKNFPDTV